MDMKLKAFAALILFFVIASLVVVLTLVWTMPELPETVQKDQICLLGADGALSCGTTPDVLRGYLEQKIATKYEEIKAEDKRKQQEYLDKNRVRLMSIYDKSYWELKPAAKLTGKELSEIRKDDVVSDMTPIREWCEGKELFDTNGFKINNIRYRNGRLVVPVDGTYFIYSFVDFFVPCDSLTGKPDVKDASKPIKHGIYKFNILNEKEVELVSNVQPHVISDNKYFSSYSSYVSSLDELKAGDELSVKVSNITYLRYTRNNYFGLNLV